MAREKAQIGLKIAERSRPEKGSFDYHSASLERWIRELPIGNIGETARLVYDTLHEVNRLEISWRERHQFLEQLREPVNYIQNSLVRRYTGQTFPLQEKSRRVALLAKTLYEEMALGYKTAIEEMLGSSFLTRDNRILTLLIHRAIRYLSKGILVCYQTYTPHPGDSWFELHTLYLHAEHKNIAQDPVKDEHSTLIPKSSIARVYKQILLLALTSPYRLRQGEAEAVYSALAHWAGHAHIIPYNAPSADHALFVVHLDSDEAPDYKAFDHRDCSNELCRLVDTRQLSHVLTDELKRHEGGNSHSPLGAELIYLLIRAWGITPKRGFSRSDRVSTTEVVVGITMLHRMLTRELGDPRFNIKPSSYDSKGVISVSEAHSHDVWNLFSSEKMKRNYEHYETMRQEEERKEKTPPLITETWQVRNESAGGYRLALEQTQNAKVQVGELLGMRSRGESRIWRIGVVRWLRQVQEGGLEIGVQALAPQARPVLVRNKQAGGRAAKYQYALLLPEIPAIKQPASLIIPIMLFQPGNELSLQLPGDDLRISLTRQLQDTGSFVQFLFSTASPPEEVRSHRSEAPTKPDHTNLNWDEI